MKIAILGAGHVGAALACAWVRSGHQIVFGARDAGSTKAASAAARLRARVAAVPTAAGECEVVVLATPWDGTRAAIESCGSLAGKIVIDCTNPLKSDLSGLAVGMDDSGAELVAGWAKGASVFKCFNQTGAENMADAARYAVRPVMFVAGDDAARKPAVLQLARDAGFESIDAGPLSAARMLEPLAMLWVHLAFRCGMGRDFAFALVRPR